MNPWSLVTEPALTWGPGALIAGGLHVVAAVQPHGAGQGGQQGHQDANDDAGDDDGRVGFGLVQAVRRAVGEQLQPEGRAAHAELRRHPSETALSVAQCRRAGIRPSCSSSTPAVKEAAAPLPWPGALSEPVGLRGGCAGKAHGVAWLQTAARISLVGLGHHYGEVWPHIRVLTEVTLTAHACDHAAEYQFWGKGLDLTPSRHCRHRHRGPAPGSCSSCCPGECSSAGAARGSWLSRGGTAGWTPPHCWSGSSWTPFNCSGSVVMARAQPDVVLMLSCLTAWSSGAWMGAN